jgi:hypothetical protein
MKNYKPHRNGGLKPRKKKTGKPFVQLFHCWLTSPVFRSLTAVQRMAVITIMTRYNGRNNGALAHLLGLGVRRQPPRHRPLLTTPISRAQNRT